MTEDLTTNQEAQKWEAPKYVPNQNERTVEDMGQLQDLLTRAFSDHILLTHQTKDYTAAKICTEDFNTLPDGTTLLATPDSIMSLLPHLDSGTPGKTHKGADALVVLTFPREIMGSKYGTEDIDDKIIDLKDAGLVDELGVPNRLILGHYTDHKFHINPNFDARVPEEWKNIPAQEDPSPEAAPISSDEETVRLPDPPAEINIS